jgi:uncharacterized protein (TIGR03067 family)
MPYSRCLLSMPLTALALLATAGVFGQDAATEAKKLEGTWMPSAAEASGQAFPDELLKTMKLVVTGDQYTVTVGKAIDKGTVKIDSAKTPKTMDIIGVDGPNKGKTFLAIYEINGDTLRVCYDLAGKNRPTEFATKKGVPLFLATYQRGK